MGSFGVFTQRTGRLATLAALVVATLAQGLLPTLASADQVTDRSVALSSSSKGSTGVTYNVSFTTGASSATAGAFVVEFCSNTPLIGQSCTAPTGMVATGATTATGGASISTTTAATANKVTVVKAGMTAATAESVEIGGITNPSAAGTIYARIVTYDTDAHAANYATTTLGAGQIDQGGVAMSITDTVGVSGAVLESMSFCVSGETLADNCVGGGASAPALTAPTLKLGEDNGGVIALTPSAVSSGTIYTQISTNAVGGAVVSLKSNAVNCGGLLRAGAPTACDIGPASAGLTLGNALFGVKTGAAVDGADGHYDPAGSYNASTYYMGYTAGNATGVTSTYGDPILNTAGAVANNLNMPLTFGASVANNTPAGSYSADLSLIATGKF